MTKHRTIPFLHSAQLAAVLILLWVGACYGAASSSGYTVHSDFLCSGGGTYGSSGYELVGAVGAPAATSRAASASYALAAGPVPSPLVTLVVEVSGSGGGSINSTPSGIACTGGVCSGIFPRGTVVTLMPLTDSGSLFSGWSGACTNAAGNCSVTMSEGKRATASFTVGQLVRLEGSTAEVSTLQGAYNGAAAGSTIKARSVVLTESLVADQAKTVAIKGGYDAAFGSRVGFTVLDGVLKVRRGRINVERIKVK